MNNQDFGHIKHMLLAEYREENPSEENVRAFLLGMTRFEEALSDPEMDEALNDFLPLRRRNEYLSDQLRQAVSLIGEIEKWKNLYIREKNKADNYINQISKSELSKLRMDAEYCRMRDELSSLRHFRDAYFEMLVDKNRRENNK